MNIIEKRATCFRRMRDIENRSGSSAGKNQGTAAIIREETFTQKCVKPPKPAENLLLFSVDIGKEIEKIPKASKNQYMVSDGNDKKHKDEAIHEMGFTDRQARDFQTLAKNPDKVQAAIEDAEQ